MQSFDPTIVKVLQAYLHQPHCHENFHATLAVTPAQAETLALAQKVGALTLSLRSLADAGLPPEAVPLADASAAQMPEPALTVVRFGVARQQTP